MLRKSSLQVPSPKLSCSPLKASQLLQSFLLVENLDGQRGFERKYTSYCSILQFTIYLAAHDFNQLVTLETGWRIHTYVCQKEYQHTGRASYGKTPHFRSPTTENVPRSVTAHSLDTRLVDGDGLSFVRCC